jgi:uncharacterized protein YrzB (UPF0473 family)
MDIDFRNLEAQLVEEEKKRVERKKVEESALDQDKNGESEKETLIPANSDDELDEIQKVIKYNKLLMEVQEK